MLGMMKAAPFSALHRLLPWAVLGLGINLVTGMLWVIGTPEMYMMNVSFFWKMGFLMLAGANLIYVTTFDEPWSVGAGENAPLTSKAIAASSDRAVGRRDVLRADVAVPRQLLLSRGWSMTLTVIVSVVVVCVLAVVGTLGFLIDRHAGRLEP